MIPVNEPKLGEREREYVAECVRSGWVSSAGHFIQEFEEQWAAYCGRRFGVALANGTTALHVAVELLDLEPGDEVIMPTFTIISCAWPVVLAGGVPVLVVPKLPQRRQRPSRPRYSAPCASAASSITARPKRSASCRIGSISTGWP